jgi:hypothetical protein
MERNDRMEEEIHMILKNWEHEDMQEQLPLSGRLPAHSTQGFRYWHILRIKNAKNALKIRFYKKIIISL